MPRACGVSVAFHLCTTGRRGMTVTCTASMPRSVGYLSSAVAVTAWAMVALPSSTAVTVNVRGASQLSVVNVWVAGRTVATVPAPLVAEMVTSPAGAWSITTV